eukprot:TRINITY_DN583_c0_g1_i1.p1 TRINITY_DN583_c0_g1~~TRINITY_DN583_c0_g1_i1.p1  ORF type:complete len:267 (+),score=65.91 TRINITY_DN583_c0_g1_i1:108-803(+)
MRIAAFFLLALVASTLAAPLTPHTTLKADDKCEICVGLFNDALQDLINIILNGGVVGGCADLCGKLPSSLEQLACNLVCDYVGIDEFIKLIDKEDPDSIYLCQIIKLCPVVSGGEVNITNFYVSPTQGPTGTTFVVTLEYTVLSPTSTGLIAVTVVPNNAEPFGGENLSTGQANGNYEIQWQLQTQPNEDEPFSPGLYAVVGAICAGDCTTIHPYGGVYANSTTSFTITGR